MAFFLEIKCYLTVLISVGIARKNRRRIVSSLPVADIPFVSSIYPAVSGSQPFQPQQRLNAYPACYNRIDLQQLGVALMCEFIGSKFMVVKASQAALLSTAFRFFHHNNPAKCFPAGQNIKQHD